MLSDEMAYELWQSCIREPGMPYLKFARAVEREATAPLIEQIKEDEALMRMVLHALRDLLEDTQHNDHKDCDDGPCPVREARASMDALRQRLETKK